MQQLFTTMKEIKNTEKLGGIEKSIMEKFKIPKGEKIKYCIVNGYVMVLKDDTISMKLFDDVIME